MDDGSSVRRVAPRRLVRPLTSPNDGPCRRGVTPQDHGRPTPDTARPSQPTPDTARPSQPTPDTRETQPAHTRHRETPASPTATPRDDGPRAGAKPLKRQPASVTPPASVSRIMIVGGCRWPPDYLNPSPRLPRQSPPDHAPVSRARRATHRCVTSHLHGCPYTQLDVTKNAGYSVADNLPAAPIQTRPAARPAARRMAARRTHA